MSKRASNGDIHTRYQVPLAPDDIVVDNSTMSAWMKCDTRAVVEYGLHLKPKKEGPQLKQGQAGHAALASWFEGASAEKALTTYERAFERDVSSALAMLPAEDPERLRLSLPRTKKILGEWFDARPREGFPLRIDAADVELAISAPIMTLKDGRRVIYVALLDALGTRRTGGRWSVDHKFTRAITDYWKGKQEDTSQFTGQAWLQGEHGLQLAGTYINGIEVPGPKTSSRQCSDHGLPYVKCDTRHVRHDLFMVTRSKLEIVAWLETVRREIPRWVKWRDRITSLDEIGQVGMRGRFNESCTFCGHREWCRVGRPVRGRVDWFVEERWNPLAERREG